MIKKISLGILLIIGIVACVPDSPRQTVLAPTNIGPSPSSEVESTRSHPIPTATEQPLPDYLPDDLWGDLLIIFEYDPAPPYDTKDEFETQAQYENRIRELNAAYIGQAANYYSEVEKQIWEMLQEVETLNEYDAENREFDIDTVFHSCEKSKTVKNLKSALFMGPDFNFILPADIVETYHRKIFDLECYSAILTHQVKLPPDEARPIRECANEGSIYMRVYMQFAFSEAYKGYFYYRGDTFPYDFYGDYDLTRQFLRDFEKYNNSPDSIIQIKIVRSDLLCHDGRVLYTWE